MDTNYRVFVIWFELLVDLKPPIAIITADMLWLQVLLGTRYNEKADIFALGMIMYELFTNNMRLLQVCVQRNKQRSVLRYAHRVAKGMRPPIPEYAAQTPDLYHVHSMSASAAATAAAAAAVAAAAAAACAAAAAVNQCHLHMCDLHV